MTDRFEGFFVPDEVCKDFGVATGGWYAIDADGRLVLGPYPSLDACEEAIWLATKDD